MSSWVTLNPTDTQILKRKEVIKSKEFDKEANGWKNLPWPTGAVLLSSETSLHFFSLPILKI